jgi:hypothetical protein
MTKDEALDLALEALESCDQVYGSEGSYQYFSQAKVDKAIIAIKQALALDKKAENARELGLDYEPVQEPVGKYTGKTWYGLSIISLYDEIPVGTLLYTTPPAQRTSNNTQNGYEHTQKGNS